MFKLKLYYTGILLIYLCFNGIGFSLTGISNTGNNTGNINNLNNLSGGLDYDQLYKNEYKCQTNKYEIVGNGEIKSLLPEEFSVKYPQEYPKLKSIYVFSLLKDNKILEIYTGNKYIHTFINPATYVIQINITEENGCIYNLSKEITVYQDFYVYIGISSTEIDLGFEKKFLSNSILFKKIKINEDTTILDQDGLFSLIYNNLYYLKNASKIIINRPDFYSIIVQLARIKQLLPLAENNFIEKNFYLISDKNQYFIRRLIAISTNILKIPKIYIINSENFINFLNDLSLQINYEKYINLFTISFEERSKIFFLSYLIDYLLYKEFPLPLIKMILNIIFVVVIINIFRQIIGFKVFGIFYPILFTIIIYLLGWQFTLFLFIIALISNFLIKMFTNKFYLLHSSNISLLISVYAILLIFFIWLNYYLEWNLIDNKILNNYYIIFPIILIVQITNKIIDEETKILSITFLFLMLEFALINTSIYLLLNWEFFNNFLLTYPDILIGSIFINIIIGRFTGLQVLEYLRFSPLIRKYFIDDEE